MLSYSTDRKSADAAVDKLVAFLDEVEAATGAKQIHIVAHSMGNRVLLPALGAHRQRRCQCRAAAHWRESSSPRRPCPSVNSIAGST